MIVVSDTSPLNYLVLVASVDVLPVLFQNVYAPRAVIRELLHPATPEVVREWAGSPPAWLNVADPVGKIEAPARLGPGELSAVALAKEIGADRLLVDERDATKFARAQGLQVVGTLAVLELAAGRDLLDLREVLRRLTETTFRISAPLVRSALERDAARKRPPDAR